MKDPGDDQSKDDLYRALGLLVVSFTQLEESLQQAIVITLGESDGVRALVNGLNFRVLTDKFSTVYAERGLTKPLHADVASLCATLTRLNEERNTMIHSAWGFWARSGRPVRSRRVKRGVCMETVEATAILALADRMKAADDKLWQLILEIGDQPRPTYWPVESQ